MRGSVTRRGKDSWLVRIFLGRDPTGKQRFHTKVVRGRKKDAERYASTKVAEQMDGRLVAKVPVSLGQYLADWLDTEARRRCRANTWQTYVELIDRYVPTPLLATRLQKVTGAHLQGLLDSLVGDGLSASTVRQLAAVLRSALGDAANPKRQLISENPAAHLDLPRLPQRTVSGPARSQVISLFRFFRADAECGLLLETMLALGLRPSEAVALQVGDLDLERATVRVQRRAVHLRARGGINIDQPKSASGARWLALPASLLAALAAKALSVQEAAASRPAFNESRLLFPSSKGHPIHRSVLRRHLKAAAAHANLPATFRLYDLRHAHATMLSDNGVPVRVAADQLGHANPAFTLKVYQHTTADSGRLAATTFDALYGDLDPEEQAVAHD